MSARPVPYRRPLPVLVPHLVWEGVLLLVVIAATVVAAVRVQIFDGDGLWWSVAVIGLLAAAVALSLRTATPNLAVGGIAALAGVGYAWLVTEVGLARVPAALVVLMLALTVGLVLGLLAGVTSAPAWAVSLAGLVLVQAVMLALAESFAPVPVEPLLPEPVWWVALFLLVSLGGAAAWAVPGLRRRLGANRATDPVRFDVARLAGAAVGFGGSSLLAGFAGLAAVAQYRASIPDVSFFPLFVALAAVLIGGVSAFGGRGGITGTVLGTALLAVVFTWLARESFGSASDTGQVQQWARPVIVGLVILVGLGISRALEAISPTAPTPPAPTRPAPTPTALSPTPT